jgi:predicted DNA-binding protein (MmcQ/YjbR family)
MSFKCSPEDFAELKEREGIRPAPYMARAQWVALETPDTLTPAELQQFVRRSYDLVFAKLPKKVQVKLQKPLDKKAKKKRT